jgi:hypothetical protein
MLVQLSLIELGFQKSLNLLYKQTWHKNRKVNIATAPRPPEGDSLRQRKSGSTNIDIYSRVGSTVLVFNSGAVRAHAKGENAIKHR